MSRREISMIVMEYLNFGARGDQEEFGLALAKMHNTEIDGVQEFGFGSEQHDYERRKRTYR